MRKSERFLRDALSVRDALHDDKPRWMKRVIATGIGPKIVNGHATGESSLHVYVARKRARAKVPAASKIPKSVEGLATDVIAGNKSLALSALTAPAALSGIGFGAAIRSSNAIPGTVACAALDNANNTVFLTAAHYVVGGNPVYDDAGATPLGVVRPGIPRQLTAAQMYPGTSGTVQRVSVDVAIIDPVPGVQPVGGLPGVGAHFSIQDWRATHAWMAAMAQRGGVAEVLAFGNLHANDPTPRTTMGWRRGALLTMFPRTADGTVYFCTIDDGGQSFGGDSGCLWIGHMSGQQLPVVGIHYGILNATRYVLVSDLVSAMPHIQLQTLLG